MSSVVGNPRVGNGNGVIAADDPVAWRSQTRVFLQPVAAPSILGLFGFAGATFIVAANLAGWYGGPGTGKYLFPFAMTFGGFAQFAAGLWAYKARDGLATAMHGMWGAFWIAYGILWGFQAAGAFSIPAGEFPAFGFWFLALGAITALGAIAALFENLALFGVLATLATGSAFLAVSLLTGIHGWQTAAGWVLLASAWLACYTAAAMMFEGVAGKVLLPLGGLHRAANIPGQREHVPLQFELGDPGVRRGQ